MKLKKKGNTIFNSTTNNFNGALNLASFCMITASLAVADKLRSNEERAVNYHWSIGVCM